MFDEFKKRVANAVPKIKALQTTREKGNVAEHVAAEHLERNGYRVVDRNFRCKRGEIDIIAYEQGELVFVEVRSRKSAKSWNPVYTVNRRKQAKIVHAAQLYLDRRVKGSPPVRFDVVIVTLEPVREVDIITNAFMPDPVEWQP